MNLTTLTNMDHQAGVEDKLRRLIVEMNTANPPSAAEIATTLASYLTTASASSTYLTIAAAAATYLTTTLAASTYLTSATAASTYLTSATAATTYRAVDTVQRVVPADAATVVATANILLLVPAGTLTTLTVTFPASPVDKQRFRLTTTQILTALTLDGGTIINPLTSLALGVGAEWIYSSTDTSWLRLQ